jgi:hypothetical protein
MATQYASGNATRVLVNKATSSLVKTGKLTDILGTTSSGIGALGDLTKAFSGRTTAANASIAVVQNLAGGSRLAQLENRASKLLRDLNVTRALPGLSTTDLSGLNTCLSKASSVSSALKSVRRVSEAALKNTKITANNALSRFCKSFADNVRSAINHVTGLVTGLARSVTALADKAISAVTDAIAAGIEGLEGLIKEGLDELRKMLPDIDVPDVVNMLLPEWLRSVPSMLNKALSPILNLVQGVGSCLGEIGDLIDDGLGAIGSIGSAVDRGLSVLDKPLSLFESISRGKSTVDYLMDNIKAANKKDTLLAKATLLGTSSFYTVGPYLDDVFGSHTSSMLEDLNDITRELNVLIQRWESAGGSTSSYGPHIKHVNDIKADIENFKADVNTSVPVIKDSTKDSITKVEDIFNDSVDSIAKDAQDSVDDIKENLDEVFDAAADLSKDFITEPEIEAFVTECQAYKESL